MTDLTRRSLLLSTAAVVAMPAAAPWNGVLPLPCPMRELTVAEMRACYEYVVGLEAWRMPGL